MSKVFCVLLVFTVLSAALIFPASADLWDYSFLVSTFTLNSYIRYDIGSDQQISGYQAVNIGQEIGLNYALPGSMVGFSSNKYYVTSNSVFLPNHFSNYDSVDFLSVVLSCTCSDSSLSLLTTLPDVTIPPLTIYPIDSDLQRLSDNSCIQLSDMLYSCVVNPDYSYTTTSSYYLGDTFDALLELSQENNVSGFEFVFPFVVKTSSSVSSNYTVSFDLDFLIGITNEYDVSDVVINGIPQINNKLTQIDNSVGSIESTVTNIDNTSTQINSSVSSIKSVTDLLPQIYEDLPSNMADALRDVILGTVPEVDLHEEEFNDLQNKEQQLNDYASDKLDSGLSDSIDKLTNAVATVVPSLPASHDLFFTRLFDISFIRDIVYISLGFGLMAFVLKVTRKVR